MPDAAIDDMLSAMLRLRFLLIALGVASGGPAFAEQSTPLVLVGEPFPATADLLRRQAPLRNWELASPAPRSEPASEAVLSQVRPLYQTMAFGKAVKLLATAEQSFIAGGPVTPAAVAALAEIEGWLGACLLLNRDRPGALEHWALAQRLSPDTRPDPLFPPKVRAAFASHVAAARPVSVAVRLAPVGARLWVDGRLVAGALRAAPGLHHVLVERVDYVPSVQVLRITHAAAQIAVDLREPATRDDALRQAAARLAVAPLGRDEGLGLSALLERPIWLLRAEDGKLHAQRFAAADAAHAVEKVEATDEAGLLAAMTGEERPVAALPSPASPTVAPAEAAVGLARREPPPKKAVWKRAWFWGVVGASVLVAAGVAVGASIGVAAPRDYDIRVR